MPLWKKYFISNTPCGVCMYLFVTTRLTVDSCMPMSSPSWSNRMHESTVSRVVTNKYMHTPQGVFEMKYFFHSGISSSYGESVSSVTIKQRIRKIIENEDPRKPLSDSKIVSILQREGLELARRTIAKYREELKIPTSNQRKVLY